ncbi:TPA: hypothetical protein UM336_000564 [Stenotrophomonas maltophilia]|nr:hypothetical protein [Stenotrophomonas maltophilia]
MSQSNMDPNFVNKHGLHLSALSFLCPRPNGGVYDIGLCLGNVGVQKRSNWNAIARLLSQLMQLTYCVQHRSGGGY